MSFYSLIIKYRNEHLHIMLYIKIFRCENRLIELLISTTCCYINVISFPRKERVRAYTANNLVIVVLIEKLTQLLFYKALAIKKDV